MENSTLTQSDGFQNVVLLPQKEIMSFNEAIDYLNVSKSFLYKMTSTNKISFFKAKQQAYLLSPFRFG